jgi:asparagine synthase (glutamine-hydrolysing)
MLHADPRRLMSRRYAIFLPDRRNTPTGQPQWSADLGLPVGLEWAATPLMTVASAASIAIGDEGAGFILGELIRNDGKAPIGALEPADARAILKSGARHLVENFWGAYLAVLVTNEKDVTVLRAPLGDLPAYVWRSHRGLLIASDADLLTKVGEYHPAVDWIGVARHLIAPDLRRRDTCLSRIEELAGGEEGRWQNGLWSVRARWSPWDAVSREPRSVHPRAAAERVADVTRRAVAARTARFDRTLVLLSGGLDSSVVAASLARAGRPFHALTMVTRDRGGDERSYARMVASHIGCELVEVSRRVSEVDIERSLARGLPRPSERSFSQATRAAAHQLACETGAQAVIHGGGGDNVFCSVQSGAPVTDRLLISGPDRCFWKVAAEIAALAQTSVYRVLRQAIARAMRRDRRYRPVANIALLSRDAVSMAESALDHPWFHVPAGGLPGSAGHIGSIAAAQSLVQSPDPGLSLPSISVLVSQPIVEACVSVPSWHWYDRGCNRAVARHGFADDLPEGVTWRRSKGIMDSFVIEIFEANREALSTMLLDGRLAANGMIDRDAVHSVLLHRVPTGASDCARVMLLADVEAWARSWGDR